MKKCILIALIIVSLFLLSNCSKVQQASDIKNVYSNNFSTLEIRSFWTMCQQAFIQKNPYITPSILIRYCDCYSDLVRRTYKDVRELNAKASSKNLSKSLIVQCNMKLQQEQALANPA